MKRNYIGENIRIYRERSKLTQQELADKVGVSWEMISRYERAASSPLKKLDKLADALKVKESQLLEEHIPESINSADLRVPLFTKIPTPPRFNPLQTNYYYQCPEWIMKSYSQVIALDASLVKSEIPNFSNKGVLFLTMEYTLENGEYIVIQNYDSLEVKRYKGGKNEKILGKLIAKEIRY